MTYVILAPLPERGLAWFRTADGSVDHRVTLQLPPLRTLVRWDDRPYVSPLAEVEAATRIDRYAHGLTKKKDLAGRYLDLNITAHTI